MESHPCSLPDKIHWRTEGDTDTARARSSVRVLARRTGRLLASHSPRAARTASDDGMGPRGSLDALGYGSLAWLRVRVFCTGVHISAVGLHSLGSTQRRALAQLRWRWLKARLQG